MKKYEIIIHISILTISIGNTRFLRDVLRAYSFISRKHGFWKIEPPLTSQIAENKILGPVPLDPHEKVNMDAEKVMSNTWYFEFMVKKTLKKLARTTEFHITPLGSLKTIYVYSLETVKQIIIMRAYYFNCTLPKWGAFFNRL